MPLTTDNIEEARVAFASLEARVAAAETHARTLATELDASRGRLQEAHLLRQSAIDNAAVIAQLQTQGAASVSPDASLQTFVASLGLATAIAEATMPDRAITSVSANVQGYLVAGQQQGGISLRLYQPELGSPAGLSSTSMTIEKIPPASGSPAPRSFYVVLAAKQATYTNPFWFQQSQARQIIVQIASLFENAADWTLQLLAQSAASIAAEETALASLLAGGVPPRNVDGYRTSAAALADLAGTLVAKSSPVAGDLLALGTALDRTTAEARELVR